MVARLVDLMFHEGLVHPWRTTSARPAGAGECDQNPPLSSGAARQVRSAVSLSRDASGRPLVESVPGEEALALQEAESGAMRLRAGEPFSEDMSALWLGVQNLAFTLVCEAHENLLLAEGTLRNLSRHCLEQLHMLGQGSEVSRAPLNRY